MKIELLVTNITAVGSPDRAERAILGVILARRCFGQFSVFYSGATLWCRNPLFSPNTFTYGHLMNIKWLVADVTAVGSPDIAEHAILVVILAERCFGQFRPYLWSGNKCVM